jgi:hypothetical protein
VVCTLLYLRERPVDNPRYADVFSDGELIRRVDLSDTGAVYEFTVETERGVNTISVSDGKIAVSDADCPDKICIMQGYKSGGAPIICLPHRVEIRFVGA